VPAEAVDERRHAAGPEPLWGESWYFDFAARDGAIGGYVRLGLYPNLDVVWWWTHIVRDGELFVVRDHTVPLPSNERTLEVRTEGLWAEPTCETPLEHWSIGVEAFGVRLDDPAETYRGERGDRIGVGLDLEWEAAAPVFPYQLMTRYEASCDVHGEILLGDERIAFEGTGQRDHSWGVRDWWVIEWCWTAGALDDGTRFHAAGTSGLWHQGYTVTPTGTLTPADRFTVDTALGAEGLPTKATMELGPLSLEVEPLGFAPVLLTSDDGRVSRFPRAMCRFTTPDGRTGTGWTEWNQLQ
jgi:hypothetical protein